LFPELEPAMTESLHLDSRRAALLSLDCQASIVSIYAAGQERFLERAASLLAAARRAGVVVIHVKVGFRPALPEVSLRNRLLGAIKGSPRHQAIFEGAAGEIHAALAPVGDEPIVTKRRVNAFAGTDLDLILRANDIDTLVLFGIATSGVVLATLLHAADLDYRLVVVSDCCIDLDPAVHACLMDRVFPRQAMVMEAAEVQQAFESSHPTNL
jgi:nicotinamidase-related amidase